jgi:transposase
MSCRVARKGEAPWTQIAKDCGISEGCLLRWMKSTDATSCARRGSGSGCSSRRMTC